MAEIKLISKDTDLSNLKPIDWDVVVNDIPMQVYKLEGYNHSIGGRWGENCYWCCPRNEEPTYENLMAFSGHTVRWGIIVDETNGVKHKWGETEVKASCKCFITRNGERFFDVTGNTLDYCLNKARQIIFDLECFPVPFTSYNYLKDITNRKIYWKEQPATILRYIKGGHVLIKAESPEGFKPPCYVDKDEIFEYEDRYEIIEDIFSSSIWWFRD